MYRLRSGWPRMNQHQLQTIMSGEDRSVRGALSRLGLTGLEPGYRLAVGLRNRLFDAGLRKAARLLRPTISIGNITAGGTGKTPLVIALAKCLLDAGSPPAVLLRGYRPGAGSRWPAPAAGAGSGGRGRGPGRDRGRSASGPDEAAELRDHLGSRVPVEPDPDRRAAARRVLVSQPDTAAFLLDDGFQHRQVHRDLDLVLIDATRPFGFGRILPRGLLREPVGNLRRADAVIVTRADQVDSDALGGLDDRIADLTGQPPIAHMAHRWTVLRDRDQQRPIDDLRHLKVVGACGIGNPGAFGLMLSRAAGEVLHLTVFDDHHAYTPAEVQDLLRRAQHDGADALMTTEKDWAKWRTLLGDQRFSVPVLRPVLTLEYLDGGDAVEALLHKAVRTTAVT